MENLKIQILEILSKFETQESFADMVKANKGIPVDFILKEAVDHPLEDMREAILELWKEDKLKLFGTGIKALSDDEKSHMESFLQKDEWFLHTAVASLSKK